MKLITVLLFAHLYASNVFAFGITVPGYRYCGLGNQGFSKPPLNELDAICRDHDLCYRQNRGFGTKCQCDQDFVSRATQLSETPGIDERMRRNAIQFARIIQGKMGNCRNQEFPLMESP